MIRFIAFTWGLSAAWAWTLFTDSGRGTSPLGPSLLGAITLGMFVYMVRRADRLRGGHEYVTARLEYHRGFSQDRWKRDKPAQGDDGGSEFTLGGW